MSLTQKVLSTVNPKFKDGGGGKAKNKDYKDIHEKIVKKLGDCKGT